MSDTALRFVVTRSEADYFWAVGLNALRSPIIPLFAVGALVVQLAAYAIGGGGVDAGGLTVLAATYGGMIALYYVCLLAAVWFTARKNWRAPGALAPLTYTLTPQGIDTAYALGQGQTDWALWKGAFETEKLVLISHTLGPVHIIPKRDLDAATLSRLRGMLRERFGAKARLKGEGGQ